MSEDDDREVFDEKAEAEQILAVVRKILSADDVSCAVDISIGGDPESAEINGVPWSEANGEEIEEVFAAGRRVDEAEREREAQKYVDPAQNPMIKLD